MIRGGYQIVDLKNINIPEDEPTKVDGIWEHINNSNGKAILLTNIVVDGLHYSDAYVTFCKVTETAYRGGGHLSRAYNEIEIDSNDRIHIMS